MSLVFFEDETTDFKLLDSGLYVMSKYVEMYWTSDKKASIHIKV